MVGWVAYCKWFPSLKGGACSRYLYKLFITLILLLSCPIFRSLDCHITLLYLLIRKKGGRRARRMRMKEEKKEHETKPNLNARK